MNVHIKKKTTYIVFITFSNLDLSQDQEINGIIVILTYFSNIISKVDNQEEKGYNHVYPWSYVLYISIVEIKDKLF